MFNRKQGEGGKIETVIGSETVIQGTLSSKGVIRVEGKVEGGITEASTVIVGEGGQVRGDVNAGNMIVGGHVIGNITTQNSLEMLSHATIQGDIKTAALSIAEGSNFEGNCIMTKEKQVIEMDVEATGTNK